MVNRAIVIRGIAWLTALILLAVPAAWAAGGEGDPGEGRVGRIIHGPLAVPEGQDYDAWKGIPYSREAAYDAMIDWRVYSTSYSGRSKGKRQFLRRDELTQKGYALTQERVATDFRIVSVTAEPIGGEMKLRSGGYVDITVKTEMSGVLRYEYRFDPTLRENEMAISLLGYPKDVVHGVRFADPVLQPFDRYTGISLMNTIFDPEAEAIMPREATDSGFVESQVTHGNRTYRILARIDSRNTCGSSWKHEMEGDRCLVTVPVSTENIYTFRVPADYDGLALALAKMTYCQVPEEQEEAPNREEIYVDILTGDDGRALEIGDYWFIRMSDLIDRFGDREAE